MAKALEYRECNVLKKLCHYSEFTKAGFGWLAIDGSRRHSQSKIGKRVNQALCNGLRMSVGTEYNISVARPNHPHHSLWVKIKQQVRNENPEYTLHLLRADLTKEAYIRMYVAIGIALPDFDKVRYKIGRGSNNGDNCLAYLNVPNDENHREVKIGKYYVDGLLDNNVYEFFGDYWHANPSVYLAEDKIVKWTAGEKWKKDKDRAEVIKSHGYNFYVIWESDWGKFQHGLSKELKITQW